MANTSAQSHACKSYCYNLFAQINVCAQACAAEWTINSIIHSITVCRQPTLQHRVMLVSHIYHHHHHSRLLVGYQPLSLLSKNITVFVTCSLVVLCETPMGSPLVFSVHVFSLRWYILVCEISEYILFSQNLSSLVLNSSVQDTLLPPLTGSSNHRQYVVIRRVFSYLSCFSLLLTLVNVL